MRILLKCAGLLCATALLAASAAADETASYRAGVRPHTWRSSPSVWGQEQWKIGLAFNSMYGGNLKNAGFMGFSGQMSYRFFDVYSLCLAVDNYRANNNATARHNFNVIAGALDFRVHLTIADAFPAFYGGVGAGIYNFDLPNDANHMLFAATLGLEYPRLHPFDFFIEYRYALRNLRFQGDEDHGLFRFGVNYAF